MLFKSKAAPHVQRNASVLRFLLHRHGLLAFAIAKKIQLGAAHAPCSLDFDLGDSRRVERENSFNAFTVGDSTNRERRIEPGPTPANHDAGENLNPLFVALHHTGVNSHCIANPKRRNIRLQLLLLNLLNDVHTMLQAAWKGATTNSALSKCKEVVS